MSSLQIISVPVVSIRQILEHDWNCFVSVFDMKTKNTQTFSRVYPDTKYRRRSASCFFCFRSFLSLSLSLSISTSAGRSSLLIKFTAFFFFNLSRVRLVKCIDLRRLDFFRCRVCVCVRVSYISIFLLLLIACRRCCCWFIGRI